MIEPLNIGQERNVEAKSQAPDLPITDDVLWASHCISRTSIASCGKSMSKKNHRKGEKVLGFSLSFYLDSS